MTTATLTLTDFLLARIAEDEAVTQAELALRGSGTNHPLGHPLDPARVLAECEAKRAIVELHAVTYQRDREWTYLNGGDGPHMERFDDWAVCASCGQIKFVEHEWVAFGTDEPYPQAACPTMGHLAAVYSDHPDYDPDWRA